MSLFSKGVFKVIFGNINNLEDIKIYPEIIQKALVYLKETDLVSKETGAYPIDGENLILQVIDLETSMRSEKRPEVHRKYIDIQFLVSGKEKIAFYPDSKNSEIDEELLEERDIIFYKNGNERESVVEMEPGCFAIFFPNDVHIPAIAVEEPLKIRKVVMKVKYSEI